MDTSIRRLLDAPVSQLGLSIAGSLAMLWMLHRLGVSGFAMGLPVGITMMAELTGVMAVAIRRGARFGKNSRSSCHNAP